MTRDLIVLEADRWRAVGSRSEAATGAFVYAVTTTGVFCRPTCPARRPHRENAVFFDTPEQARRAGYRACKRCRPEVVTHDDPWAPALREACRLLSAVESIQTRDVAAAIGWSGSYFQRRFKARFGITPQQFRRRVLIERSRDALASGRSVTEVVYDAGFSSSSRFYATVGRELGMLPSRARLGAPGERVYYHLSDCTLGRVIVAWTLRGVCQVGFGEEDEALFGALRKRFRRAQVIAAENGEWFDRVVAAIESESIPDVPLDLQGTVFQERVWKALRDIPVGETRTYSEVADAVGRPSAARGVARAIATNPVAVIVPCHRVVGKGGRLTGYRWGLERKQLLLEREAASTAELTE